MRTHTHTHTHRCNQVNAREAAYSLLVELASGCYDNLASVAQQLITMHHQENSQIAKEWEVGGEGWRGRGRGCSERET